MLKGAEGLAGGPEEDQIKRNMYATAAIFTPGMAQKKPPLQQDIDFVNAATAEQLGSSPALHPGEGVLGGRKIILSRTLQLLSRSARGRTGRNRTCRRCGPPIRRRRGRRRDAYRVVAREREGPKYKLHMNERRRRRSEADMAGDCDVLVTR